MEKTTREQVVAFRINIRELLQRRVLEAVEGVLEEVLSLALGTDLYGRSPARRGYCNGSEARRITTAEGTREVTVPRARVAAPGGSTKEFRSQLLPRYARRTAEVDEVILACYLSGANSRRIRKALGPLLGEEHLSKSAVSRVVARLKELFAQWSVRDMSAEGCVIVFLDGFNLNVRLARRVVSVPVLAALGVGADGEKRLLALRLAPSEANANWRAVLTDLQRRGLPTPRLVVVDGHQGLGKALDNWSGIKIQRCTVYKLRNLLDACPAHARGEMKRDYHRITNAKDGLAAREAYEAFLGKWSRLCAPVARSLEEAGEALLTFYEFPKALWSSLRSTNSIENLNREFRRRTKTQARFGKEEAALTLLYGLVAFGQIRMNKVGGHRSLAALAGREGAKAA